MPPSDNTEEERHRRCGGGRYTNPSNAIGPAKVLLHLIGVPVDTTAGLRLRLGDPGMGAVRKSAEAAVRGETALLAADRLQLDNYQLVVLQEDPVASPARLDSERERTASMRELAADAFAAGAAAVVLVPALPPKVAEDALHHLVKPFRKAARDPGRQALLDAVGRLRRHIATWSNEAWRSQRPGTVAAGLAQQASWGVEDDLAAGLGGGAMRSQRAGTAQLAAGGHPGGADRPGGGVEAGHRASVRSMVKSSTRTTRHGGLQWLGLDRRDVPDLGDRVA